MAARKMSILDTFDEGVMMSKDDFIFAICPKEYRPKVGNPIVEKVVRQFLTMELARLEELHSQKKMLFVGQAQSSRRPPLKPSS